MTHADPDMADVVYQFHGIAIEVIYQCRNADLSLADLQNLRADATAALEAIERAVEVATPIDLTRVRCACYPSGRMNLAPANMHLIGCPWSRPGPT